MDGSPRSVRHRVGLALAGSPRQHEESAKENRPMNNSPKKINLMRWWWPAILMMAIIFVGSTDLGAMSHQSRFLVPFLRWLGLGDPAVHGVILTLRKLAHL